MTGGSRSLIETWRQAVRKRAEETSLRATAEEIGLRSYTALGKFARGETATPQRATLDLIAQWYLERASARQLPNSDEYAAAVSLLGAYVRHNAKSKAVSDRRLKEVVDDI